MEGEVGRSNPRVDDTEERESPHCLRAALAKAMHSRRSSLQRSRYSMKLSKGLVLRVWLGSGGLTPHERIHRGDPNVDPPITEVGEDGVVSAGAAECVESMSSVIAAAAAKVSTTTTVEEVSGEAT